MDFHNPKRMKLDSGEDEKTGDTKMTEDVGKPVESAVSENIEYAVDTDVVQNVPSSCPINDSKAECFPNVKLEIMNSSEIHIDYQVNDTSEPVQVSENVEEEVGHACQINDTYEDLTDSEANVSVNEPNTRIHIDCKVNANNVGPVSNNTDSHQANDNVECIASESEINDNVDLKQVSPIHINSPINENSIGPTGRNDSAQPEVVRVCQISNNSVYENLTDFQASDCINESGIHTDYRGNVKNVVEPVSNIPDCQANDNAACINITDSKAQDSVNDPVIHTDRQVIDNYVEPCTNSDANHNISVFESDVITNVNTAEVISSKEEKSPNLIDCQINDSNKGVTENETATNEYDKSEVNQALMSEIFRQTTLSWQLELNQSYQLKKVEEGTIEFSNIAKIFRRTALRNMQIVSIERVENPYLLSHVLLKKEIMCLENETVEERRLFHGTRTENVHSICTSNFDWRKHGKARGHKFGQGVSFAKEASWAHHYTPDNMIILSKVLVSKSAVGDRHTILPPVGFDTTQNPEGRVIVKYEDDDFVPEYVIYYNYIWDDSDDDF